jgi:competence protein ComEA
VYAVPVAGGPPRHPVDVPEDAQPMDLRPDPRHVLLSVSVRRADGVEVMLPTPALTGGRPRPVRLARIGAEVRGFGYAGAADPSHLAAMSSRERHALVLLFSLGLIGHALRLVRGPADRAGGKPTVLAALPADGIARQYARSLALARPVDSRSPLDLNRASVEDIARLPRIGVQLAKAIARARDEAGGFAGLADLDQVPGVGPSILARLEPLVSFGDTTRLRRAPGAKPAPNRRAVTRGPGDRRSGAMTTLYARDLPAVPRVPAAPAGAAKPGGPIDLNSATEADLLRLKGIGPARAKAVLAYRQSHGPFASVAELEKVPGLSRRLVAQLAAQVTVR